MCGGDWRDCFELNFLVFFSFDHFGVSSATKDELIQKVLKKEVGYIDCKNEALYFTSRWNQNAVLFLLLESNLVNHWSHQGSLIMWEEMVSRLEVMDPLGLTSRVCMCFGDGGMICWLSLRSLDLISPITEPNWATVLHKPPGVFGGLMHLFRTFQVSSQSFQRSPIKPRIALCNFTWAVGESV